MKQMSKSEVSYYMKRFTVVQTWALESDGLARLALWSREPHLTSLCLSLPFCKMGRMKAPSQTTDVMIRL